MMNKRGQEKQAKIKITTKIVDGEDIFLNIYEG